MNKVTVKIHRLNENVPLPEYKTSGAAAFDLAVSESGTIEPGETKIFPTGLVVCVPENHVLLPISKAVFKEGEIIKGSKKQSFPPEAGRRKVTKASRISSICHMREW